MNLNRHTDIVTIGESMMLLQPLTDGPLAYAPLFTRSVAGAESNVAIGLSRLGLQVRWISRLGADAFGDSIMSTLAGERIDVSQVERDSGYPTSVYFKEFKGYGDPNVYYYRKGSAVSQWTPAHIKPTWFEGAKHFHVTGITPALGEHTADTVRAAMVAAREQGLTISFDPNLRRKLWSEETAHETLLSLIPLCDVFMPGVDEASFLLGAMSIEEYAKQFLAMGAKVVVIKLGEEGSIAFTANAVVRANPYAAKRVVDTVGAGDAFAAGFLAHWVQSQQDTDDHARLATALQQANIMGSLAVQYKGDWEGLPSRQELEQHKSGVQAITR